MYECKGTTQPQDVDKMRNKAKQQLDAHREEGVSKMALVMYLPTSAKLIPPFLFVSDPPVSLPAMSATICVGIHYLMVCEFSGLTATADALRALIVARLPLEQAIRENTTSSWRLNSSYRPLADALRDTFNSEIQRREAVNFNGDEFVGVVRQFKSPNLAVDVFTGVGKAQFENVISTVGTSPTLPSTGVISLFGPVFPVIGNSGIEQSRAVERASLFSDGTLFWIQDSTRNPENEIGNAEQR